MTIVLAVVYLLGVVIAASLLLMVLSYPLSQRKRKRRTQDIKPACRNDSSAVAYGKRKDLSRSISQRKSREGSSLSIREEQTYLMN